MPPRRLMRTCWRPFIAGAAIEACAQNHELALARRQRIVAQDVRAPRQKRGQRLGRVRERAENVERRRAGIGRWAQRFALLGGELSVGERRDAGCFEMHGAALQVLPREGEDGRTFRAHVAGPLFGAVTLPAPAPRMRPAIMPIAT